MASACNYQITLRKKKCLVTLKTIFHYAAQGEIHVLSTEKEQQSVIRLNKLSYCVVINQAITSNFDKIPRFLLGKVSCLLLL